MTGPQRVAEISQSRPHLAAGSAAHFGLPLNRTAIIGARIEV